MKFKKTRVVKVGKVLIGGNNQIVVQSMTNTSTTNITKTVNQIKQLTRAGCEMIRASAPDEASCLAFKEIKKQIKIPIVADIHFDYKLAILAMENGADKIRINPGNLRKEHLAKIIEIANKKNVAIRVGVNSGSLNAKHSGDKAEFMVEKALEYIDYFEENGFENLVISLKSSDVKTSFSAYEKFRQKSDYPLHLGITESGSLFLGAIKSSVGLALLLEHGIGDTLRVSLTDDPIWEVFAGYKILQALGLRQKYPDIISCPTCARTSLGVIPLVKKIEKLIWSLNWSEIGSLPIKIAIMGCVVNGPGEAKEADFGFCGTGNKISVFEHGKIVKTFEKHELNEILNDYLQKYLKLDLNI